MAQQYHLKAGPSAASAIDEYVEYQRLVRDDDGGVPFTSVQYEAYKKRVFPLRVKNRLFVSWCSTSGMDCKLIGPETQCFCQHRYHQHKTDLEEIPDKRPISLPCQVHGCRCSTYHYIPVTGSRPIRCSCKHLPEDHKERKPYSCTKGSCDCPGFRSAFTCGCGEPCHKHKLVVETKEERLSRGHPVGEDVLYKAMGGITGFSSLLDGYMRLDPSGVGAPSEEFLNQPITASDHPFLRANVQSIKAHKINHKVIKDSQATAQPSSQMVAINDHDVDDMTEMLSAMRRPGESDMDFFERRYQERRKQEKSQVRHSANDPALTQQRATAARVGQRGVAPGQQNKEQISSSSTGRQRSTAAKARHS